MPPFAKLTLKKVMVRGSECPNGINQETNEKLMDAKDFDLNDLSDSIRRYQLINSESAGFGKKSRTKAKTMKFIGKLYN